MFTRKDVSVDMVKIYLKFMVLSINFLIWTYLIPFVSLIGREGHFAKFSSVILYCTARVVQPWSMWGSLWLQRSGCDDLARFLGIPKPLLTMSFLVLISSLIYTLIFLFVRALPCAWLHRVTKRISTWTRQGRYILVSCSVLTLTVFLLHYLAHIDWPARQHRECGKLFSWESFKCEDCYYYAYGFLDRTWLYKFTTDKDGVDYLISKYNLKLTKSVKDLRFGFRDMPPYWWQPGKIRNYKLYSNDGGRCYRLLYDPVTFECYFMEFSI